MTEYQAAYVKPPTDVGSDEFGVKKIDSDTTHKVCELPRAWAGKFVTMCASGGVVHYGFSTSSSAEISTAVATTDAGASAKVGAPIPDSLAHREQARLPSIQASEKLYLIHESTVANTVLYVWLSSG